MIQCNRCHLSYDPAKTPGGHCPRCLLSVGPGSSGGGGAPQNWEPPSIADVQALLHDYEILGLLGRGGMGAVYKARQRSLDRLVAIKILPPLVDALGVGYVERFKNEARLLAKLDHPGIVHVYDFGELPGQLLHFVMEYVDGTDVARLVASQGRLSPEHAASITAEVCAALHCAHQAGVVHRDVKPANILVARDGRIKVADFGLAKKSSGETRDATTAGLVMGTTDYAAPESLTTGMIVDHRADLYAVGVMLYNMLTGDIPRGVFPPASEKVPAAGPRFDEIINKALQKEPQRRYQSAELMKSDVERAGVTPATKPAGRRTAVAAVVAVAAVLVLVGGWLTLRPPGSPAASPADATPSGPSSGPTPPAPGATATTTANTAPPPVQDILNPELQRAAAEWVLAKGGTVGLEGETGRRDGYWALPKKAFQVAAIYFENVTAVDEPITDEDLARHLPHLPGLRQFIIIQSPGVAAGITDAGARLIAARTEMQDIGLDGVRLSEETVQMIGALPHLRALLLSHSTVNGDCLRPAVPRMCTLSLTYCDVDAAAWRVIASMPKLELVRFIGTTVDDSMVEAMLALPELRRLGWLANPATEGALKRIRAGNPKIEVRIFKTWNTTEPPPLRVSAR